MPIRQICVCSAIVLLVLAGSLLLQRHSLADPPPSPKRLPDEYAPLSDKSAKPYKTPFQSREYVRIIRDLD